jgi:hypothetical protein
MYERNCPECDKELTYGTKRNWEKAEAGNNLCRSCSRKAYFRTPESKENRERLGKYSRQHFNGDGNPFYGRSHSQETIRKIQQNRDVSAFKTDGFKEKMSRVTSGTNNPMYDRNVYNIWVQKYGEEEARKRMADLSAKRSENSSGEKNPMYGKPAPKGSGNGWGGWYKGWYFRSLKELSYMLYVIEPNNYVWKNAECKELSIPYVDHLGAQRTYRADFLLEDQLLIEVKPKALMETAINKLKKKAAERFCAARGLEYRMVDVKTIEHSELLALCQKGLVKLGDPTRLEKKYANRRNR